MRTTKFHNKILSRLGKPEDYAVYRAGLEWDLTDPIVIESKEDFKSTPRWRQRLEPYRHQVSNLITFCRRLPVTLLADDVGLGKTISAGLIVSELAARGRLSKVLIVCPKLLCPQWKQELESKFDIPGIVALGKELLDAEPGEMGAVITTYNSARLYLERLPEDRFEMLILDEAHKLRNLYGVPDPPQVAKRFHKALQDRRFRYVLMLTATPIQNRLWDLYSLVDLLTVARGHENPFGAPGLFARKFIADDREQARQLKLDAREEFRSIVYGYMSRVRRGDAQLAFPERVVQMHPLQPTAAELELIDVIAEPIQKMNRLAQISILQALASSPDALLAQLLNMARKGTVSPELAASVKAIVATMPPSAKLQGLGQLIGTLKQQNPDSWRLVVFTTRRETQTTIQAFLESHNLTVGLINGDSGQRNQETITRFRENPPGYRVIVSTEAGSEGVNLQVANVLVNFDLPWNPMIVEQRIGRIQRLASEHDKVSIFNITLRGTFEEYIVGRLMQKLQMAAHAIGDIESLLQSSDVDQDGEGDGASRFEDRILILVLAALARRNVEKDVALAVKSIEDAKRELEREEANINALLGAMDGTEYVGPTAPTLPGVVHSMPLKEFTLASLPMLGSSVREEHPGIYVVETSQNLERIRFDDTASNGLHCLLYAEQTPPFQRLVKRSVASCLHSVTDTDLNVADAETLVRRWADKLSATIASTSVARVRRSFRGELLLRVRATVAHDSYERLITITWDGESQPIGEPAKDGMAPMGKTIRDLSAIGVDQARLIRAGEDDDAIAEFCRFYEERRDFEIVAAKTDARKRKKLDDDFTPRLEITLVGAEGTVQRDIVMRATYSFASGGQYESDVTVRPRSNDIIEFPKIELCSKSGQIAPKSCFAACDVTGARVLQHLLIASDISGRKALPEFIATCAMSGKRVLQDESGVSDVTGRRVTASLLRTSALSGKRAEPEHFGRCDFTGGDLLSSELAISGISGKTYRVDAQTTSDVSDNTGHASEFISCRETRQTLAPHEAETCEATGYKVRPGVLLICEATRKRVLPSLIGTCKATGKRALRRLLVESNVSQASVLKDTAISSLAGNYCLPAEGKDCLWSGRRVHPDDIRSCALTGVPIHVDYLTVTEPPRLTPLVELLDGMRHNTDEVHQWGQIAERIARALKGGKYQVEASFLSPNKRHLATCTEARKYLGLRTSQIGALYDVVDQVIVGRLVEGKRGHGSWSTFS